jgi:hypothetical protein
MLMQICGHIKRNQPGLDLMSLKCCYWLSARRLTCRRESVSEKCADEGNVNHAKGIQPRAAVENVTALFESTRGNRNTLAYLLITRMFSLTIPAVPEFYVWYTV